MKLSSITRPRVILVSAIIIAIAVIAGYFIAKKTEKRYIYFVVDVKYKPRFGARYAHRCYVSDIHEIHWDNFNEEKERLQDKAMFQIRERVQATPECESIIQVIAPNYMTTSYQEASDKMYESLRDKERYCAEYGDGKTETFNIQL